jgi:hypothetical protein
MKKSYVYFIAPLVGLLIFGAVYWQYASTYDARLEAAEKHRKEEREKKIRDENEQKKEAVAAAQKAQEQRKKEKAEKEAREQKEADDREKAVLARDKAREDSRKFADQVARLRKEVDLTKGEIEETRKKQQVAASEEEFLRRYVKEAQANRQNLTGVLTKVEAADKAFADAAKAAAAAAAAKKQ